MGNNNLKKWTVFKGNCVEKSYAEVHLATIKNFSANFREVYEKMSFHDFVLLSVNSKFDGNEVIITLYNQHNEFNGTKFYELMYKDVQRFNCSLSKSELPIEWMWDEFTKFDDSTLFGHRIICTDDGMIEIVFSTISIKRKEEL